MPTLKLTLAYDGTKFAGWQRQKSARTVQATLEAAFEKILQKKVHIIGAGRTDSGVHAKGQVAHAVLPSRPPLKILTKALNAILPEDLVIRSLKWAPQGFHARYQAKWKWYRYRIWNALHRPLFQRQYLTHVGVPLDRRAMENEARKWVGRHDFKAFASSGRAVSSTVRTIRALKVKERGHELTIDIEADGYLYHMVRRVVGFLIEVGKGKRPRVAPTAPAKGLCLMKVWYR